MRIRPKSFLILVASCLCALSASAQVATGTGGSGCSTPPECAAQNQVVINCQCQTVCAPNFSAIIIDAAQNLFGCDGSSQGGVVVDFEPLTSPAISAIDPCAEMVCIATMRCQGGVCVPIDGVNNEAPSSFTNVKSPKKKAAKKNKKNKKKNGKKKKS